MAREANCAVRFRRSRYERNIPSKVGAFGALRGPSSRLADRVMPVVEDGQRRERGRRTASIAAGGIRGVSRSSRSTRPGSFFAASASRVRRWSARRSAKRRKNCSSSWRANLLSGSAIPVCIAAQSSSRPALVREPIEQQCRLEPILQGIKSVAVRLRAGERSVARGAGRRPLQARSPARGPRLQETRHWWLSRHCH